MQAPRDGDSAVSDVRTCQDRGERIESFVTRNCSEAGAAAASEPECVPRAQAKAHVLCVSEPEPGTVPVPQVLGWSGGGSPEGLYGRVTIGIEGAEVAYVPETTRGNDIKPQPQPLGFDAWYASPYTRVYERNLRAQQDVINAADGMLSLVLHELAGSASLCWEPKPAGTFDSEEALRHVEQAIARLRAILRSV